MRVGKVKGWLDRLVLRTSPSKRVDGLLPTTPEPDDAAPTVLCRVEAALLLIKLYDRVRYNRLLRDLGRVQVLVVVNAAYYDKSIDACVLDARFVLAETTSLEDLAAAIVHEATHARLMRRGIGYDEPLRSRVEANCVRREIAFAKRLPAGETVREAAEGSLEWCADSGNLTNEAFYQRKIRQAADVLRYLGWPSWLVQVAMAFFTLIRGLRGLKRRLLRREQSLAWRVVSLALMRAPDRCGAAGSPAPSAWARRARRTLRRWRARGSGSACRRGPSCPGP